MLSQNFCFLDLETTGIQSYHGRIIEIGIVKVCQGQIVEEYESLVNPQTQVDPFIQRLTGIRQTDLELAPTFDQIKSDIIDLISDSVIVAHNVRFDYSFLRHEFKRLGIPFSSPHFCTIKLARSLFPQLKRYSLDEIIANFNISCPRRHRALGDAQAIWQFFQIAQNQTPPPRFHQLLRTLQKKPSVPLNISPDDLENIPESSGVYIFYGQNSQPLYIGKSINLKDRILSHFSNDHLSSTDFRISRTLKRLEVRQTAGELGALLLESKLIKQMQPLLNRRLRHSPKLTVVYRSVDPHGYYTIDIRQLSEINLDDLDHIVAVCKNPRSAKEFLNELSKEYHLCPKLLGLEKPKKYCFHYHLGFCHGACQSQELPLKYNLRFDQAFYKTKLQSWKFDGPILIKEEGESTEYFVVDKWCLLGTLKSETDSLEDLTFDYNFDLDTYKILRRFLNNPKNMSKIIFNLSYNRERSR